MYEYVSTSIILTEVETFTFQMCGIFHLLPTIFLIILYMYTHLYSL